MKELILAGNAITAEILKAYLDDDDRYAMVGATVDDEFLSTGTLQGVECIGLSTIAKRFPPGRVSVVMAMGYNDLNRVRESMYMRLKAMGYAIETYVHRDAHVLTRKPLGEGAIILPGAVVEPHVEVGANSSVWCNATLAHHCHVEDHCWIASGAVVSGKARIGSNTFVGVNATVVNELVVGELNVIGAGALITKNTKPNSVHLARSAEEWRHSADDYVKFFGV